jgi:hypothetical protein
MMQISKNDPIPDLKKVISRLFEIEFDEFDFTKYHPDLPQSLKEIYEMDAFFLRENCAYETIRFFCNQDRLVKYQDLTLEEPFFTFVNENQGNWYCKTKLNSDKVLLESYFEIKKEELLPQKIDEFLTTFALQEVGFNLPFYFGLDYGNFDEIKPKFSKIEDLWIDKKYVYEHPHSYYLVDDDCLVMWGGMNIFATKNEEKFDFYKPILKHYNF